MAPSSKRPVGPLGPDPGRKLIKPGAHLSTNTQTNLACSAPATDRHPEATIRRHRRLISQLVLASLCLSVAESEALKVSVSVPELVKLNDPYWLNCSHKSRAEPEEETERGNGEDIYSIKWYKDDEELYRYLPKGEPKVTSYETNGIQLDLTKSSEGNVYISKADVNSEGNYRCEILSEAPSFETVRKSKFLKVYALPVRGPRIEILDSNGRPKSPKAQEISYAVGDKIELRCNSAPSKPAARLRWYLNEHEITIPSNLSTRQETSGQNLQRRNLIAAASDPTQPLAPHNSAQAYDVRVTPVEYRLVYKGIYSSHSTLSLVLHQKDLINNKISFKCLASMRQEVGLLSKQLLVLPPTGQAQGHISPKSNEINPKLRPRSPDSRTKRQLSELILGRSEGDVHPQPYQRSSAHRYSSRTGHLLGSVTQPSQPFQKTRSDHVINNDKTQMPYVYEDSDSTLGPSIVETPENLEAHMQSGANHHNKLFPNANSSLYTGGNNILEFNQADNLEYIQLLRDKGGRNKGGNHIGILNSHNPKRGHGVSSLVKSPFYIDELDPLRPLINWPPLGTGKLILLPPTNTIVAIPTRLKSSDDPYPGQQPTEQQFVLPPKSSSMASVDPIDISMSLDTGSELTVKQVLLDRLMQNLNCTCTEGSLDLKLTWMIDDSQVPQRDTKYYPVRISPDHRQTWFTIGLAPLLWRANQPLSIQRTNTSPLMNNSPAGSDQGARESTQQTSIRIACQAIHSILLYSSSEMITFDFNPSPPLSDGVNSEDKFSSLPSNVINAASVSQTRSGGCVSSKDISGSHIIVRGLALVVPFVYQVIQHFLRIQSVRY